MMNDIALNKDNRWLDELADPLSQSEVTAESESGSRNDEIVFMESVEQVSEQLRQSRRRRKILIWFSVVVLIVIAVTLQAMFLLDSGPWTVTKQLSILQQQNLNLQTIVFNRQQQVEQLQNQLAALSELYRSRENAELELAESAEIPELEIESVAPVNQLNPPQRLSIQYALNSEGLSAVDQTGVGLTKSQGLSQLTSNAIDLVGYEAKLREGINDFPEQIWRYEALGMLMARQQRWSEAQMLYQQALSLDRSNHRLMINSAITADHLHRSQQAITLYQRVLSTTHALLTDKQRQQIQLRVEQLGQ